MKEATTARLDVGDTTASAVEALLKCVYTDCLDASDAASVLPLAHRYQIESLVKRCGEMLLRGLSPETVARTTRGLRSLREDRAVAPLWDALVGRLLSDEKLFRAALEKADVP